MRGWATVALRNRCGDVVWHDIINTQKQWSVVFYPLYRASGVVESVRQQTQASLVNTIHERIASQAVQYRKEDGRVCSTQ